MKDVRIALLGVGKIGRELVSRTVSNRHYRYVSVSDKSGVLVADKHFREKDLSRIVNFKSKGGCLADLRCAYEYYEDVSMILNCSDIDVLVDVTYFQTFEILNKAVESSHILLSNKIPVADITHTQFQRLISKGNAGNKVIDLGTTVGAGMRMPDMVKKMGASGIDLIYGCLSGTMNFLSQRLNEEAEFSSAVKEAMSHPRYYTEPDPRVDLAGLDFARKLVILSRLAGESVDLDHVKIDNPIPDDLHGNDLKEFLNLIGSLDYVFQRRIEEAYKCGKILWFLGTGDFNKKEYKVGFEELPDDDPIARSRESDNVLKIFPRGWRRPVTVMGPGAGIRETVTGLISSLSSFH